MSMSLAEYNRELETLRRNNMEAQKRANRFVGIVALVMVFFLASTFVAHWLGVITLPV